VNRYHGKRAAVYMSTSASGTAIPVSASTEWTLNMATDKVNSTAHRDANKRYVTGLPDIAGTLAGIWEDTEDTLYSASRSVDGVKIYLYPSIDVPTKYWYGPAWVDCSFSAPVEGLVTYTSTFSANGDWGYK